MAPIPPLAWGLPYAIGVALKKKKKKKKSGEREPNDDLVDGGEDSVS